MDGQSTGQSLTRCPDIILVYNTPKGRGIFASAFIPTGTILETCPVLILDPTENEEHVRKTKLYHYTYNWPIVLKGDKKNNDKPVITQAIVLGLGSMFNHSHAKQNAGWTRDVEKGIITYRALRNIQIGEEICISYGSNLTFIDADRSDNVDDEGDGVDMLMTIRPDIMPE